MTSSRLTSVAADMRAKAKAAEQGRWKLWGMTVMADPQGTGNVDDCIEVAQAFTPAWCDRAPRTWNADYIAAMHPAVALALADWLDVTAHHVSSHNCEAHCEPDGCREVHAALALCDAYEGSVDMRAKGES